MLGNLTPTMKRRVISVLVCLTYVSVALTLGVLHDHSHNGSGAGHSCAACAWQIGAVADVPVVGTHSAIVLVESVVPHRESVPLPPVFSRACASRAPPHTSA